MQTHTSSTSTLSQNILSLQQSVACSKSFISLYNPKITPNQEEIILLATAYQTLAIQESASFAHSKLQINSSITLLQSVKKNYQNSDWCSLIASAYSMRAELLEQDNCFVAAFQDYQKALDIFEKRVASLHQISDPDKLLLAQSSISMADLLLNESIEISEFPLNPSSNCLSRKKESVFHPLFYVNKSLEYLSWIANQEDEVTTTLAYAHQIAGLSLATEDFAAAKEAFRAAISTSFKAEPSSACRILGDIYNSIGLLYEQALETPIIQNQGFTDRDSSFIYFSVALFFLPSEGLQLSQEQEEPQAQGLDSIFESIYRVIDPILPLLEQAVVRDLIDVLIFVYHCVSDNSLPNETLLDQLSKPDVLMTYAQHIFWLLSEYHRRENPYVGLLELDYQTEKTSTLSITYSPEALAASSETSGTSSGKIYYLNDIRNDEAMSFY